MTAQLAEASGKNDPPGRHCRRWSAGRPASQGQKSGPAALCFHGDSALVAHAVTPFSPTSSPRGRIRFICVTPAPCMHPGYGGGAPVHAHEPQLLLRPPPHPAGVLVPEEVHVSMRMSPGFCSAFSPPAAGTPGRFWR